MILRTIITGLAGMILLGCNGRNKISEQHSFVISDAFSDSSSMNSCEQVIWATDSILITTARNDRIQAYDVNSRKELWNKHFDEGIDAITCNSEHVYVALNANYPHTNAESIRRLDVATGADSTPKGIPQPFSVHALIWSNQLNTLCVMENEGLWIYSTDLLSVTNRVSYSGNLSIVTSDGKSVLLAERTGSCTLIDLKDTSINHLHGPPNMGPSGIVAMDAPFLSNAFHSKGGKLIRIIDNSWSTGRIFFHNTPKDTGKELDSENGHAVAAVHWPTQRLAVSGTEKNLLLLSTEGKILGEIRNATSERTYDLAFSPSGFKIATLGQDGEIKIFNAP